MRGKKASNGRKPQTAREDLIPSHPSDESDLGPSRLATRKKDPRVADYTWVNYLQSLVPGQDSISGNAR